MMNIKALRLKRSMMPASLNESSADSKKDSDFMRELKLVEKTSRKPQKWSDEVNAPTT